MSMRIYLDNAATSAVKPLGVYTELFKNTIFKSFNAGRGTYKNSISASGSIMDTAESIAELFNIEDASRIAFMPNATYALNFAINGFLNSSDHVVITGVEHNSVLRPVHRHGNYTVVKPDRKGNVRPEAVKAAIRENTRLVICTHASNVSGTVEPIEKIGQLVKNTGARFLVDAAQTAGIEKLDVLKMNIDMLAFSGHKGLMGPLGTGGLYVDEKVSLSPIVVGGTGSMSESFSQPGFMPDMLQSGTQNTPAVAALKAGVDFVKKHSGEILEKELYLAKEFINALLNIPGVTIYGNISDKRNATVAFNIKKLDCIRVAEILESEFGILVRSGLHCAPLAHKSLGTAKTGCIRASFGYFNSQKDMKKAVDAVNKISKYGYNI